MPADRTTGGFGSKLREARERRGVSLRQIANATKISVSALGALERNDISRLPGGIFSRAFVRSYAIEVGLDPEEAVQEFIAQFPKNVVAVGHPTSDRIEDNEALESERRSATTFLRLIALSLPVAGIVIYFGGAGRHQIPQAPETQRASTPAPQPRPAAAPVAVAAATEAPAAEEAPSNAAARAAPDAAPSGGSTVRAPAGDRIAVGISATRPCWVSATIDGERAFERLLQTGEQRAVEVRRELVLTVGDAAAIKLTLNGAEARSLGRSGEVVTIRLGPANFKNYLPPR